MKQIFEGLDKRILRNGAICLLLMIIWSVFSISIGNFEKERTLFNPQTILQVKMLLVVIIFTGRYLLFPGYRLIDNRKWLYGATFLLITGINLAKILADFHWLYFILKSFDTFFWAFFGAAILEVIGGLFCDWGKITPEGLEQYHDLWRKAWRDIWCLGIWFTLLAMTAYYYLINFFIIDTLVYSYIFAIMVWILGNSLFAVVYGRLSSWVNHEIQQIDEEMMNYLNWVEMDQADLDRSLPLVQYLLMLRDYIYSFKKPVISIKTFLYYIIFGGCILVLPYIAGVVVEVSG